METSQKKEFLTKRDNINFKILVPALIIAPTIGNFVGVSINLFAGIITDLIVLSAIYYLLIRKK